MAEGAIRAIHRRRPVRMDQMGRLACRARRRLRRGNQNPTQPYPLYSQPPNSPAQPTPRTALLSRLTALTSTTHSLLAFTSFLTFLLNGRYRTLTDRLLRLRLAPPTTQTTREVSFEYLNRQLVWHAFTEFLLFLLPLVGISRWRRWLTRAWRKTKSLVKISNQEEGGEEEENSGRGELAFLPERTCPICYSEQNPTAASETDVLAMTAAGGGGGVIGSAQTDITNPYETVPCGCLYCFVCIATRLEAEEGEGWTCLRCGEVVKECKPWAGDVVVEEEEGGGQRSRPGTGKSVSFEDEKGRSEEVREEEAEIKGED